MTRKVKQASMKGQAKALFEDARREELEWYRWQRQDTTTGRLRPRSLWHLRWIGETGLLALCGARIPESWQTPVAEEEPWNRTPARADICHECEARLRRLPTWPR